MTAVPLTETVKQKLEVHFNNLTRVNFPKSDWIAGVDYVEALLEENENHPDEALIHDDALIDDKPLQNQPGELVDHFEGYNTDVENNNIENENRNDYENDNK